MCPTDSALACDVFITESIRLNLPDRVPTGDRRTWVAHFVGQASQSPCPTCP
jgi:hypothetical protein